MTFEDVLKRLKTNPKNSGVSETILKGVATRIAKTLPESASAEEIETRFSEEQEFIAEMQAENDRRANNLKKEVEELKKKTKTGTKPDDQEDENDPNVIEANGRPRWWNKLQEEETAKKQAESETKSKKEARERDIREVAKELGISDKQLDRIFIKDEEDPRTVLTEWKQEMINESIPAGDSIFPVDLSTRATDQDEAKRLVEKFKVK